MVTFRMMVLVMLGKEKMENFVLFIMNVCDIFRDNVDNDDSKEYDMITKAFVIFLQN